MSRKANGERSRQRGLGSYYTPPELADRLIGSAVMRAVAGLAPRQIEGLRVLDPAVGDGALLASVLALLERAWLRAGGSPAQRKRFRRRLVRSGILGIDIDEAAVARARARLAELTGEPPPFAALRAGDTLTTERLPGEGGDGLDLIVGNPPWISARVAAAEGHSRAHLRARYRTARGAHDLAAAFVERSLEALQAGGRMAMLLPRALMTAQHGAPLRELLTSEATISDLVDASDRRHFAGAAVYPILLGARRSAPCADDQVDIGAQDGATLRHALLEESSSSGFPVGVAASAAQALATRRRAGVPLTSIADVFGMTCGFDARRTAGDLREKIDAPAGAGVDFVTTGNVRPFSLVRGKVRYQRRTWEDPVLVSSDPHRHRRDRMSKILVAGMGLRLRATWCADAVAAGVGVFGVGPRQGVDPFHVLGCLNAASTTSDYQARFPGKRMAGGYLAVNGHTLADLPLVPPSRPEAPRIATCARHLHECGGEDESSWRELDQLVEQALA